MVTCTIPVAFYSYSVVWAEHSCSLLGLPGTHQPHRRVP